MAYHDCQLRADILKDLRVAQHPRVQGLGLGFRVYGFGSL